MFFVLFLRLYKKFNGEDKMRMFLSSLLFAVVLEGVSARGDSIGCDTNGAWKTEIQTNMILRGGSREVVETVITNRITQDEYHWRQRVALVRIGMRRDDVEKLLPPYSQPEFRVANSSGYLCVYRVDERWSVAMWYDNTGARSDANGKIVSSSMGANKLALEPGLRDDLELWCLSYHVKHHHEDEQAAKVAGLVEFTGYRISVARVDAGEALVGIQVVSQKSLYHGVHPGRWACTEERADWQERWHSTKDGWILIEQLGVRPPVGIWIF